MNRTTVILVSGKMGSGKTTLQKDLVRVLHSRPRTRCHLVNFADPLYEMHNFCVGLLKRYGIERDIVKDGPLLQLLGTEWGRKTVDENIWVKTLQGKIDDIMKKAGSGFETNIFIVGDCRFKNELEGFPNAIRVRLECDRETRKLRCEAWRDNELHPSEIDLDDWVHKPQAFDLIFNTATQSTAFCSAKIANLIEKGIR